jgi:hypothetical protein
MDQINESVDIIVQYGRADHIEKMIKLPYLNFISTRPLYSIQQRDIVSIRQYFNDKNFLLLPTYATMNKMYLCDKTEMDQKVAEHFLQTKAYTLIHDCIDMNQDELQTLFNVIIHQIDSKLLKLFRRHRITIKQYGQMLSTSKRDENQINSMIFLPDTRTVCLDVFTFLLTKYFSTIGNSIISFNDIKCFGTNQLYFTICISIFTIIILFHSSFYNI